MYGIAQTNMPAVCEDRVEHSEFRSQALLYADTC
jgi:hypothetical protein